ncbi:histidine phosphatase family protein [Enterococcus sp. DIV0187]|uniref:histidine phosphatase family protein n=1 Tax=Enterococcus sp. DIV0187 TaxID=2774644 RepID=UPI003F1E6054
MEVYLVRHGETILNQFGKIQGWCDSFLTEKGKEQAYLLAKKMEDIKFDCFISSDSGRAIQTAKIISMRNKKSLNFNVYPYHYFREYYFGSFEAEKIETVWKPILDYFGYKTMKEMEHRETMMTIMNTLKRFDPSAEAENHEDFWHRVDKGFENLLEQFESNSRIFLLSHENFIRSFKERYDKTYNLYDDIPILNVDVFRLFKCSGEIMIEF